MRIILDECVPRIVKRRLPSRSIATVQEMGWAGIKNGELLRLVAADFDVFVTSDKNLKHQQNLDAIAVAVILLPSNQVPVVLSLIPQIEGALTTIGQREFVEL